MYAEKFESLLSDIENKDIHLAGGSVIGMVLSIVNSLIRYIANLTVGKKNYENVQKQIDEVLKKAYILRSEASEIIDKDSIILDGILCTYRNRKQNEQKYQECLKDAVEFCINVLEVALKTFNLTKSIEEIGNKMLESDFKICRYYSQASIMASIENIKINLKDIEDIDYKKKVEIKYNKVLDKYCFYNKGEV